MFQAAEIAEISPLRIGFTGTLNVIRRAIPHFQSATTSQLPCLGSLHGRGTRPDELRFF